ncbi:MAG: hypothetical protein A3K65_00965 [Euryarchaeota archaeon RBG_16_68_12]|nr:MAG: hypothetical protein A3K65_00965 [Euryarchaeota archaeon RBG_16_68_12]
MPEAEDWLSRARSAIEEAEALAEGRFFPASITRSYYAMFYAARALLTTKGVSPKSHGGTLQKFAELFVRTGLLPAEMSSALGAAMELREQADYQVNPSALGSVKAKEVLEAARRFVDRAAAFLQSP